MGDLKPLGSEKLQGDDKLKRILELTFYNNNKKATKKVEKKSEFISESINGVFGIVKEKDGYYVKRGINENTLDYIGGLFMKNKNKFSSYAEALKRLELLRGQELQEAKKYVLKQNKTTEPAPEMEQPAPEMPMDAAPPSDDMGEVPPSDEPTPAPEMPMDDPTMGADQMGAEKSQEPEEVKRSDYMSEIQKFSGKLGQSLRDVKEKLESDDIKYTINMILSAIDVKKLDKEDRDDIIARLDFDEDEDFDNEDEQMDLPVDEPEMSVAPEGDDEMDMEETMRKLEEFINEPSAAQPEDEMIEMSDIFSDEADIAPASSGEMGGEENYGYEGEKNDELVELDLDEIKSEINKNINQTLSKYFN